MSNPFHYKEKLPLFAFYARNIILFWGSKGVFMSFIKNTIGAAAISLTSVFTASAEDLKPYSVSKECVMQAMENVLPIQDTEILNTDTGVGVWVNINSDNGSHGDISSIISTKPDREIGSIKVQTYIVGETGDEISSFATLDYEGSEGPILNIPDSDTPLDAMTKGFVLNLDGEMRKCATPQVMSDATVLRGPKSL